MVFVLFISTVDPVINLCFFFCFDCFNLVVDVCFLNYFVSFHVYPFEFLSGF